MAGQAKAARAPEGAAPVARAAAGLLVLGLLACAAAYGSAFLAGGAPGWAAPALASGAVVVMTAVALLGVARSGAGGLVVALVLGGLALAFAMVALWTIPPADPADPALFLGLPPRASHLLYGIGLLPALVVPLVYALTFERATLSAEDLRRLRAAAQAAALPADASGPARSDRS